MNFEATDGVQPPPASVTAEVFDFLMIDKESQVFEVSLAVVAYWAIENLLEGWHILALLVHHSDGCKSALADEFRNQCTMILGVAEGG